jgi:tonB-dependent heme receptor
MEGLFSDKKYGINFKNKLDSTAAASLSSATTTSKTRERESHYAVKMSPVMSMKHDKTLDLEKTTHAFYFMEKHKFTKLFDLSFGYRFEFAQYEASRVSDMKGFRNGIPFPPMTSYNAISDGRDITNHAFEFTPNFRYSDTGNVYFKFERGYISPSPSQPNDKDQVTKQYKFNDLKSEKFNTYEIGLKDHVASMPVNATVFLTDTSDEIAYAELGANHGDA